MGISEAKKKIVIDNYFKVECDMNTSIKEAFTKGFELGLKKAPQPKTGHWEWMPSDDNPKLGDWHCSECRCVVVECVYKNEKRGIPLYKYCPQCGIKMVEPQESEDKG